LQYKYWGRINVSERVIQQYEKSSFTKKLFFNWKVTNALKDCNNIESYLLTNKYLSKSDHKLNLIISDGSSNEVENSYFLTKGYTADGGISPIRKYTIINGKTTKCIDVIRHDIIIIDLYEESIYLHSYSKGSNYITGYLVEEDAQSKKTKSLIFSNKKIKINIKNINKFDTINEVDDFVNKFIM